MRHIAMSHRTQQSRGFYLKLPENLQLELPLYSHEHGYCIRDDSLTSRVQRALLNERAHLPLAKTDAREACWYRWWPWPWWYSLKYYLALAVSHACVFSLGAFATRRE